MKISFVLLIALFFNTTLLIAEPLFTIVKNVDPAIFIGVEIALLLIYFGNKLWGDFSKAIEVNLSKLEIVVYKKRR